MEPISCPECTNEISEGDTACPRCGTPLEVASAAASAAGQLPLMSVLNESQPPASPMQVIATRVAALALVGWLVAIAVFAWIAYDEGYVDTLLPLWNTVFVVGTLPLVAGVFARRMWAQRWTLGIAAFTGLGHVIQANETGSSILWVGVAVLTVVVIILAVTKSAFRHDNAHRGTLARLLATAVTIGSLFVYVANSKSTGTERGRVAFATEIQRAYETAGVTTVRVFVQNKSLVIEGLSDTDAQIDEAAEVMQTQLRTHGKNAKAWVLGFQNIKITNGAHERSLRPTE